jgi:UDP-glucose 4-epimerase
VARYLVTGGAGFIGSCLSNMLLDGGATVHVYDNLSAGQQAFLKPGIEFTRGDILDTNELFRCVRYVVPDTVFHLAAYHFIPFCNAHPEGTIRCNVEGTCAVLRACVEARVPAAVVASSGALYADKPSPITENDVISPYDIYGVSKRMAETCAAFFAERYPIRVTTTRLFNTFGPNETQDHLIPAILRQIKIGDRVTLGNIENKRDYVFVEDTASALIACTLINKGEHTVVNVGAGQEYSAREIINTISRILGRDIRIEISTDLMRKNDKTHQIASISLIHQLTGWLPRFTFEDGLRKLLRVEGLDE